jgi:hypothetical protein
MYYHSLNIFNEFLMLILFITKIINSRIGNYSLKRKKNLENFKKFKGSDSRACLNIVKFKYLSLAIDSQVCQPNG